MKLTQCEKGHFYDADKYTSCPHCTDLPKPSVPSTPVSSVPKSDTAKNIPCEVNTNRYSYDGEKTVAFYAPQVKEDSQVKEDKKQEILDTITYNLDPVVGWLVCTEGCYLGKDFKLVSGRCFIGRSKLCTVCLEGDSAVDTDNHASIIYDPRTHKFFVLPGETGLTSINDNDLTGPQQLKDGDIISCGKTKLCFISFCNSQRNWS